MDKKVYYTDNNKNLLQSYIVDFNKSIDKVE
jgi:hypothetical protein